MTAQRLIIVSNRGPFHLHVTKQGIKREKTVGGLVTSLLPMIERVGGVWIAWGEPEGRYPGSSRQSSFDLRYIRLSQEQARDYYCGLANNALWPLCHYFLGGANFDGTQWQMYEQVNSMFAQATLEEAQPDDLIWVQDYHLSLVPGYLRRERPNARIAYFWHIPFPAVEVFRALPWRHAFLEGILSSDIVGFHIPEYMENFVETVADVLDVQVNGDLIRYGGHTTRVLARPIGIDCAQVEKQARSAITERRARQLRDTLRGQAVVLGVERMDYTKGIAERLQAMERLLERQPDLHGKITLIQLVTPSRNDVVAYQEKKREIDEIVGRINGRFSDGIWMPIRYQYRPFSPFELMSYYRAADIALVTPLRDGLNLVAKEYVASRIDSDGVLILSEFAGAAWQLSDALLVNPYNIDNMAYVLELALNMPKDEQRQRMKAMQARIRAQDISWWSNEFLDRMNEMPSIYEPDHIRDFASAFTLG